MSKEIIDAIRKTTEENLEQLSGKNTSNFLLFYSVAQSYLLLQILDELESINTNIDALNSNMIDVEHEVSRLKGV